MRRSSVPIELKASFPESARTSLRDTQLRRNLGKATQTIRGKRAAVVNESSPSVPAGRFTGPVMPPTPTGLSPTLRAAMRHRKSSRSSR